MTLTIDWLNGTVRVFKGLSQRQVNRDITYISNLQDIGPEVPVKITVTD